jgi:hypothetical protein
MTVAAPHQLILFGPPGTSKSHTAKTVKVKELNAQLVPIAFHPEFSYGEFVARLLPMSTNGKIQYNVHAGPFLRALAMAYAAPEQNVVLLIDEINRGNCSEIFGDIFQLLDRDDDGGSCYPIVVSELTISALRQELEAVTLEVRKLEALKKVEANLEELNPEAVRLKALKVEVLELEANRREVVRLNALKVEVLELGAKRREVMRLNASELKKGFASNKPKSEPLKLLELEIEKLEPLELEIKELELLELEIKKLEPLELEVQHLEAVKLEAVKLKVLMLKALKIRPVTSNKRKRLIRDVCTADQ